MRYEIEEYTHAVRIFYPDSDAPSLYQPDYPDLSPWASKEDAENWAKLYIASIEDENAPFAPSSPGVPGDPKPTPEELELISKAAKARQRGE